MFNVNFDCKLQLSIHQLKILYNILVKIDEWEEFGTMREFEEWEINLASELKNEIEKANII